MMSEQATPQPRYRRWRERRYPEAVKHRVWWLLIAVGACAEGSGGAVDDRTIEGVVLDDYSERGVSGAKVTFVSDALDRAETTTQSDGSFELRVELTAGVLFGTLAASRDGYAGSGQESVYFDGSSPRMELRLRPR